MILENELYIVVEDEYLDILPTLIDFMESEDD